MSNTIDGFSPSTSLVTDSSRSGSINPSTAAASAPVAPPSGNGADTATLSSAAQQLANLSAAVDRSSGLDVTRIATLQAAINRGTYQVDSQSVAAKLLATQNELQ